MTKKPNRTLKEAIDLDTMKTITSDDLLDGGIDYYQRIRHNATERHLEQNYRYACARCGHGVYVGLNNKKPLWNHYTGASDKDCPWWTGDPNTVHQVSANQFHGQQERPLHRKLKFLVEELLQIDPYICNLAVEKTINGEHGRRRPDVQATYKDKDLAFEIQLATTQIPIILAREKFYQNENRFLIWLLWQFEERPIESIQQAFIDVLYRHQKHVFSLDEETIALSHKNKTLVMRTHAYGYNGWVQRLVTLDDLIWPDTGLPYVFSLPQTYSADFRNRWLERVTPDGMKWSDQQKLIGELALKCRVKIDDATLTNLTRLFSFLLSLEHGTPLGTKEENLFAAANSFLNSNDRHKYATLLEQTAKKFGQSQVLQNHAVHAKLTKAKTAKQVKGSQEAKIIKLAFEDWFPNKK